MDSQTKTAPNTGTLIRRLILLNSLAVAALAVGLFIYPPVRAALDIQDPALRGPGTPNAAWRLYKNLTPRYAEWAKERVAQGRAEGLSRSDISGTEWPLFGSVFYLWAIENLQGAWEAGDHRSGLEPRLFAKDAIVAASELVIDPKHASWVKKHWGENYLHRENVFYRMLVIAALTSREKLLHDGAHMDLLRDQVETFAAELDASQTGLLDDYPGECYPGDVMAAVMCIKRADSVLGTDHSRFVGRALRGFIGRRLVWPGLPPYSASSATGFPSAPARGCANSYVCLTSPELWPDQAKEWYAAYERYFWQRRITAFGFREFGRSAAPARPRLPEKVQASLSPAGGRDFYESPDWGMDVDAGPVIAGHGVAASAFGIGAARKNGRFDHAYPLSVEMLVTTWELPNGVLAAPRLLSNMSDAPLLGEASILWLLSIQPEKGFAVKTGGVAPSYVYIVMAGMLLIGVWLILKAIRSIRQARSVPGPLVLAPKFQFGLWVCLVLGAVVMFRLGYGLIGMAMLLPAVMLPIVKRQKASTEADEWPEAEKAPAQVGSSEDQ